MNTRCPLFIVIGSSAVALAVLSFALNIQNAQAITRAEILNGYKAKLKQAYNVPSLNPAVTALCQLIARRLHPILPDTSQLDYDLDKKQNEYFEKIGIQLDLDKKTRGLVAWRIFRDACKSEVGYYNEPSRWNGYRHDIWSNVRTQQERVKYEKQLVHEKEARAIKEAARKAFRKAEESYRQIEQEVHDIERKAKSKFDKIINEAYLKTQAILVEAEQQAQEIKSKARQEAQRTRREAYQKALSDKMKANRQTRDTKDQAIKQADEERKKAYQQANKFEQQAKLPAKEVLKQSERKAKEIQNKTILSAEEELKRTMRLARDELEKARTLYDRARKVYDDASD